MIEKHLQIVLRNLAHASRNEDVSIIIHCLRYLDQHRNVVATWTFEMVVDVLRPPFVLTRSGPGPFDASLSVSDYVHARRTHSGEILHVFQYLREVVQGEFAPGGPNSLYWDGWEKE